MNHKNELIDCFQDTLNICFSGNLQESTEKAIQSNKVYKEGFTAEKRNKKYNADIIVEPNTSFNAAKAYQQYGKVAVLNFANPHNPGGGIQNGAMAQEECLCRSSNLYPCISNDNVYNDYYLYNKNIGHHFFSDRLIYTKDVTVFKDDSYVPQIMPKNEWFNVDVITCAAPYITKRKYTNKTALKELFKGRIKNIFEAAVDNNAEVLILGAFGCGAFKNPPEVVAKAFHEVIDENNYNDYFRKIVFAIKTIIDRSLIHDAVNAKNIEQFVAEFIPCEQRLFLNHIEVLLPEIRFSSGRKIDSVNVTLQRVYPEDYDVNRAKGIVRDGWYTEWGNHGKMDLLKRHECFYKYQFDTKYYGKQFSILGDSISTLAGYNPKGYNVFYDGENCEKSGVKEMKDTWWGKVIDFFGGELLVNNSWSGSRVTRVPNSDKLFPSGCSDERTSSLHINSVMPDVIIIYLGTNDWAFGAETDGTLLLADEYNMQYFSEAYNIMLGKIKSNYPNAEIWCCTLNTTFMSSNPSFKFPYEYAGTHIEEYNQIIKDTADMYKCKAIDLYDYHLPYDSIDGSHPNADGMNTLATMIIRSMGGKEIEQFMDCENGKHKYSFLTYGYDQNGRGGYHVCEKCGKIEYEQEWKNEETSNTNDKCFCTKCGAAINKESRFCPKCGNRLSEYDICPNCQQQTLKHTLSSDYCINCNYEALLYVEKKSPYIWNPSNMNTDDINYFEISFGDCPIFNVSYDGLKLTVFNRINGSRDGNKSFPDDFFDDKTVNLTDDQNVDIIDFIKKIDFSTWKTEDYIRENYEMGACGFCINNSFTCIFNNGECFKCYEPKFEEFNQLVDFIKGFCDSSWFESYYEEIDMQEKDTVPYTEKCNSDAEYVMLPSDITRVLYPDMIKLFDTDKNQELEIQKVKIDVGRNSECDLYINDNSISRIHASFFYEESTWFIMDKDSKNGTWLNDKRLEKNKKYELYSDDVISFSNVKEFIFYKSKVKEEPKSDIEKELALLEEACEKYVKSDLQDINAFKIIAIMLSRVPMYFPVDIDVEAMLGNIDPLKLKAGDVITPSKDVKIKILTIDAGDEEIIPMFTSAEQAHKGPSLSITRFHPQDYLSVIIPMNKSIIINPFGESPVSFKPNYLTDIILPLVQDSLHQNDEKENENSNEFNIGTIIDDKYELLRQIGQGAFTKAYLAMDKRLNKMWLAKICAKSNSSKSIIEAMKNEVNMVKNLNHDAIPHIVDIIDNNECFCIIEDYIEGVTLEDIVKNYGAQPVENVVDWAKQLCGVLDYFHLLNPPHIYRDMKPANVMLQPNGNIKIFDFGIMRTYKPNKTTDTCSLGTKGYAAPEQYGGRGQTDARTDIYGLGMTMYHLLTGIDPKDSNFVAKPICQINPDLPKGLEYIINKCIQIDPKDRYQSCNELLNDLTNYQQLPPKKSSFSKLFKKS